MRLPVKMYLIIFIGASVIVYQYHLSNARILFHKNSENFNAAYIGKSARNRSAEGNKELTSPTLVRDLGQPLLAT